MPTTSATKSASSSSACSISGVLRTHITTPLPVARTKYCDERVCLSARTHTTGTTWLTENDGHENGGPLELQDMKLQHMKMTDQITRHEIAGHKSAGHEIAAQKNRKCIFRCYI